MPVIQTAASLVTVASPVALVGSGEGQFECTQSLDRTLPGGAIRRRLAQVLEKAAQGSRFGPGRWPRNESEPSSPRPGWHQRKCRGNAAHRIRGDPFFVRNWFWIELSEHDPQPWQPHG